MNKASCETYLELVKRGSIQRARDEEGFLALLPMADRMPVLRDKLPAVLAGVMNCPTVASDEDFVYLVAVLLLRRARSLQ